MKKGLSEIVLIVDKSGSMAVAAKDTIGGLNTFIKEQKKLSGEVNFTLVLFDIKSVDKLHRVNLKSVNEITEQDYIPQGNTALIDAVCETIDSIGKELAGIPEMNRPEKVIVSIMTDGEENASTRFKLADLAERIKTQTDVYKWEFFFLGANIDVFKTGASYNVLRENTQYYSSTIDLAKRGFEQLNTYNSILRETVKETSDDSQI